VKNVGQVRKQQLLLLFIRRFELHKKSRFRHLRVLLEAYATNIK